MIDECSLCDARRDDVREYDAGSGLYLCRPCRMTEDEYRDIARERGLPGFNDAPIRCDECGEPCDASDAVTDGNIALCGSFYGNGCADRAVWRGDLIVGIDGKEW